MLNIYILIKRSRKDRVELKIKSPDLQAYLIHLFNLEKLQIPCVSTYSSVNIKGQYLPN